MKTASVSEHYHSYLLRGWREGEGNQWRWILQNVRTGEQKRFRDMEARMQFLQATYGENLEPGSPAADFPHELLV